MSTEKPRHSRFKKFLSTSLALGMLQFGAPILAYGNKTDKDTIGEVARARAAASFVTFNGQQVKAPTPLDMYREFYNKGVDAASEKRGKDKAVRHFTKAIKYLQQAYSDKRFFETLVKDGSKLEGRVHKYFNKAVSAVLVKKTIKEYGLKEKLGMKKGLGAGAILGILGGTALAVYGISKILKKKPVEEEEEKDYLTNITFKVIKHTQGIIGNYTINDVMTSSQITIPIADLVSALGITNVDDKRIAVRGPLDNCSYLDFDRDGDAIFTVSRLHKDWGFNYTVFLMNTSNNTDYGLIDEIIDMGGATLMFSPHMSYERGTDTVQGPESLINEVVSQLNNAITYSWMTYGSIKKIDTGGGDFVVYYTSLPGNQLGGHGHGSEGYFARVDPNNCGIDQNIKAIWNAEIFELITRASDLGGGPSNLTITDWRTTGDLNTTGKELLAYVFVKDMQGIGVPSTASSLSAGAVLDAVNINANIGGVDVGITRNGVRAGFGNKNVKVDTNITMRNKQLENTTNAYFAFNNFNGQFGMNLAPGSQMFSASGAAKLYGVLVGANGMVNARTGANNIGFRIGTNNNMKSLIQRVEAGYNRVSSENNLSQGFSLAVGMNIPNLGSIALTGSHNSSHNKSSAGIADTESSSVGISANLDLPLIQQIMINGNYKTMLIGPNKFNLTDINISKKIGPGIFSLGFVGAAGRILDHRVTYGAVVRFN